MKKIFVLCMAMISFMKGYSQDFSQYEKKEFTSDSQTLMYRILYPLKYDAHKAYPLIIFLHGAGQWGSDNETQLQHAGSFFLQDNMRKKYHAIVILPQCPKGSSWSFFQFKWDPATKKVVLSFPYRDQPIIYAFLVKKLADSLVDAGQADKSRIYVGGLSMGGFGAFDMVERYPDFFAAGFPICGGGDTTMAPQIAGKTALWIFHGGADPLVNVEYSRQFFHALQNQHADVRYSEYPGVKHNSWDNAFAEKDFPDWLFSKRKNK